MTAALWLAAYFLIVALILAVFAGADDPTEDDPDDDATWLPEWINEPTARDQEIAQLERSWLL